MDADTRIKKALRDALDGFQGPTMPPKLAAAIDYAVFPGGHRIRPRLCLAVAAACGDDEPRLSDAAAVAVELLHCASLVHDDMPVFDDSPMRRGKPSVHMAFGQPLALLTGDALIVLAFQVLAAASGSSGQRITQLVRTLGQGVGLPAGIVAGQAWECEDEPPSLEAYHRSKTGALFAAATMAGAAAAGSEQPDEWQKLGASIGEAYQVADDLLDRFGDPDVIGKPVGRDSELGRPNCARDLGFSNINRRLATLIDTAAESIPDCPGQPMLREHIQVEARRFIQSALNRRSAA